MVAYKIRRVKRDNKVTYIIKKGLGQSAKQIASFPTLKQAEEFCDSMDNFNQVADSFLYGRRN